MSHKLSSQKSLLTEGIICAIMASLELIDIFCILSTVYSSYSRNLESRNQRIAKKYSQQGKVTCKTSGFMMCLPKIPFSWGNYVLLNLKFKLKMVNLPAKD